MYVYSNLKLLYTSSVLVVLYVHILIFKVSNVIIWGNHSSTQFPDASHATVVLNGKEITASEAVKDDNFLRTTFVQTVQKRGKIYIFF